VTTSQTPSYLRTAVPLLVAAIASWLVGLGIDVTDELKELISTAIGALIGTIWYVIVRQLEKRWPALGVLIGYPKSPDSYSASPAGELAEAQATAATNAVTDEPEAPEPESVDELPAYDGSDPDADYSGHAIQDDPGRHRA